jgi:hypothetical protein
MLYPRTIASGSSWEASLHEPKNLIAYSPRRGDADYILRLKQDSLLRRGRQFVPTKQDGSPHVLDDYVVRLTDHMRHVAPPRIMSPLELKGSRTLNTATGMPSAAETQTMLSRSITASFESDNWLKAFGQPVARPRT